MHVNTPYIEGLGLVFVDTMCSYVFLLLIQMFSFESQALGVQTKKTMQTSNGIEESLD